MSNNKDQIILQTAAQHFAANGFSGARMDDIAEDAKVNKATIYYRIGDKEVLYERVYADIIDSVLIAINPHCETITDPQSALRSYIKTIAQLCSENPNMPRIVLREVASQGQHLPESTLKKMHEVRLCLSKILDAGINQQVFQSVNPFMIHMLIIGFLNFYSAGTPIREKISTFDDNNKDFIILGVPQVAEELAEFIINSISKPSDEKESEY